MYSIIMRTTFSIDPDLAPKIKALVKRKKDPLRKVLNDLIRAAIGATAEQPRAGFQVKSAKLGLKTGIDPLSLNSLYDELECESQELGSSLNSKGLGRKGPKS